MHKPDFPRRSLVCGPEDPAWFSRMVRTDGAHGVVHREDRPPPRVDHLSRYIDFTLRVRNRLRAAATSRDRTMAKSPGCRPFGPPYGARISNPSASTLAVRAAAASGSESSSRDLWTWGPHSGPPVDERVGKSHFPQPQIPGSLHFARYPWNGWSSRTAGMCPSQSPHRQPEDTHQIHP